MEDYEKPEHVTQEVWDAIPVEIRKELVENTEYACSEAKKSKEKPQPPKKSKPKKENKDRLVLSGDSKEHEECLPPTPPKDEKPRLAYIRLVGKNSAEEQFDVFNGSKRELETENDDEGFSQSKKIDIFNARCPWYPEGTFKNKA